MSWTIACVGHDGYRAGAQLLLLDVLRWLRSRDGADLIILLARGGTLVDDYRKIAPTVVLGTSDPGEQSLLPPPVGQPGSAEADHRGRLAWLTGLAQRPPKGVDLIYANSIASVHVLGELKARWQCPVLCHVRELEMGIREFCGVEAFRAAQPFIDGYIVGTAGMEANLVRNHGVQKARVHRVPVGIPLPRERSYDHEDRGAQLARDLGIPQDGFVVGGCGTTDWRKGPDIFIQVARHVVAQGGAPPIHFVWVGGGAVELERLRYDTTKVGLDDRVHWVGTKLDPREYFSLFAAFLMTSREDSFPLVCLEAATLGVPTICFRDAGGIPEFVEDDAGFVVPYLDVEAAASSVLTLTRVPELRMRLGRRAAEKVYARHDIEAFGQRLVRVFAQYVAG